MSYSSDDEEDYGFYGTPLDPIEEDAVPSKRPTPIEEQIVRDKQGRRRFHGAFTGGFSAGYCNTVGSQEGWTPSSFKSSRSEKASLQAQKPEDFMDEEDVSEFGFAPKVLRATADYKQPSTLKRSHVQLSSGPIPGQPVLRDILQPVKETVGVRLLRRMGWRPGQGVGPRLNRLQKKKQKQEIDAAAKRVYGCAALPDTSSSQQDIEESSDGSSDENHDPILFAPHDYDAFLVRPKDDVFGMGYKGLDRKRVLSSHVELFQPSFLGMEEKKKKVAIWGQAFGVGALEDDDEDIYAKDDMSQYDFALETNASVTKHKKDKHDADPQSSLAISDSRNVLEGFVPGKKMSTRQKKFFKPPVLPSDYKPVHIISKVADVAQHQQLNQDAVASQKQGSQKQDLRANSRASMLDEPLPVPPLFFPDAISKDSEISKPDGAFSSSNFRPFSSQPDKQSRYEKFLDFARKGQKDLLSSIQPASMTDWDKEHECSEFEQAARLYKPLSGVMSDRFVSATQGDDSLNPLAPVERMKHGNVEMQNAAKLKMYGKLTRTSTTWQPCALLCKRFNVPPPSCSSETPQVQRRSRFSVFDFLDASKENNVNKIPENDNRNEVKVLEESLPSSSEQIIVKTEEPQPSTLDSKNSGNSSTLERLLADDTGKEQLEPEEKPDLFKAIFLSSSEESDSDEETVQKSPEPSGTGRKEKLPVLRNMSPPRGIFANLDLDSINSTGKETVVVATDIQKNKDDKMYMSFEGEGPGEDLMYGPRLPAASVKNQTGTAPCTSTSFVDEGVGGVWVERSELKSRIENSLSSKTILSESDSGESNDSSSHKPEKKHTTSILNNEKSSKEKHRKHSKHKKEKKHKKHKSKSKHKKRKSKV